jgi:isocitrate/isopropylmalate dehydrogenase
MSKKRIAVIAGDGIGKEVMPEGLRVMEAAASKFNLDLHFDHFDFSSWDYFEKHGQMLPNNWKDQIGGHALKAQGLPQHGEHNENSNEAGHEHERSGQKREGC